jgi:hypothetical protein
MNSKFKAPLAAAVVLAVTLMAACSSAPPKVSPPPPPPPAPAVVLGPKLIEQASAYRFYMDRVSAISPAFQDADAVAKSLQVGAAYEPTQMLRGAIAYGAVAALQDPAFVAGVKTYSVHPEQRREVAYAIMRDPAYAVGLAGSASAAGLAVQALGGEGQKLYDLGKAVKQSAYDVQKLPWSKADVPNRDLRLSQAKMLSATPLVGDLAESARLTRAATGAEPLVLTGASAPPPYSPVVIRSLAVAALAILGEAGDANIDTVMAVMAEPNVGFCMSLAKLNLYQCLAVSKPHYEDVFCLGQHAMMDTGRCLIKASGLPEPYEARFIPVVDDKHGYGGPKKPANKAVKKKH